MNRQVIVPLYLPLCILLGGASLAGYLSNLLLQLIAIPIIAAALLARRPTPLNSGSRSLLTLLGLATALVIFQLIPLPPSVWSALPGREPVVQGFVALGQSLPWLPLSMSPEGTLAAVLWLLPAVAVLLAMVLIGAFRSTWLAWTLAAVTILSVMIGTLQVAGGHESAFYFYAVTNRGFAVGPFANNNHMATLMLMTIPFLVALISGTVTRRPSNSTRSHRSGLVVASVAGLVVIAVGLTINTSLAGIGLAAPVAAGSALLLRSPRRRLPLWTAPALLLLIAAAVTAVLLAPLGNNLVGEEASATGSRRVSISTTVAAAVDHLPFGSGLGTFVDIYRTHEDHLAVTSVYMNHAHSDWAELALETGLPGLVLLGLFLLWWIRRSIEIWRPNPDANIYARAATIASAAVILHSVVDYPLRTAAISAAFAACIGLMSRPRPFVARTAPSGSGAKHLSAG